MISELKFRMKPKNLLVSLLALISITNFHPFDSSSWADAATPRYLAVDGRDSGNCANMFRPCRSIAYAARQARKGDPILAAEGTYHVRSAEDTYFLLALAKDMRGGFQRNSHYRNQDTKQYSSTILGAPVEAREILRARGFHVVTDQKSMPEVERIKSRQTQSLFNQAQISHATSPCVNGLADIFPCQGIDLLSHIALEDFSSAPASGTDIWGFVDLNTGREYALMGLNNSTSIIDLSLPGAPREIAHMDRSVSSWRDIKVHQHFDTNENRWKAYAYISSEDPSASLSIIDLSDLPNSARLLPSTTSITSSHNVFISGVDYTFGLQNDESVPQVIVLGSQPSGGAFRSYALDAPVNPTFNATGNGYTHDAASMLIRDSRKDSQCANGNLDYCEILFDFNEDTFLVWDITVPDAPVKLSTTTYPNAGYVHSGWTSEDQQYLFVHDELDERNFSLNTTVRVFDLADLRAPTLHAEWVSDVNSIDHNGFSRGSRYYMSNYTRGITILDIADPGQPSDIAFFDTVPATDNGGFTGTWGAYPYLPSGLLLASNIGEGFFTLRPHTEENAAGHIAFGEGHLSIVEGNSAELKLTRTGGTVGNVSIALEIIHASTDKGDISISTTQVDWSSGDAGDKFVTLSAIQDSEIENLQLLFVRLLNPQGALLGQNNLLRVNIADTDNGGQLQYLNASLASNEELDSVLVTIMRKKGFSGVIDVSLRTIDDTASAPGDYTAISNQQLHWDSGDTTARIIEIQIPAESSRDEKSFTLEMFNITGINQTASTQIKISLMGADASPPPPPPPPPTPPVTKKSGGGGSAGWITLLVLLCLIPFRLCNTPKAPHS